LKEKGLWFQIKLGPFDLMLKSEQANDRMLLTLQVEEHGGSDNNFSDGG
jgi:hypothetical protein